jgi:hypothetical protein
MKDLKKMIADLQPGQTLLAHVTKVTNDAAQLKFMSHVENPYRQTSLVAELNSSDSRFTSGLPRFTNLTITNEADLQKQLPDLDIEAWRKLENRKGVNEADLVEGKHFIAIGIINPSVVLKDGSKLQVEVQIQESIYRPLRGGKPDMTQEPKLNPTTGAIVTHNGKPVFQQSTLVPKGTAKNVFLQADLVDVTTQPENVNRGTGSVTESVPAGAGDLLAEFAPGKK